MTDSPKNNNTNDNDNDNELQELMKIDHTYPTQNDPNFLHKIYNKREFYYHKYPQRPEMGDYEDIQEFRNNTCSRGTFQLQSQQSLLSNFINPDTPYKGLLVIHGTGTGKTCGAIAVAEKFKDILKRYNTKVYVLLPGPLLKENWKSDLLKCTGDTYLQHDSKNIILSEDDKQKLRKNAIANAMQYYKFISYRSFYKKVLGERIIKEKKVISSKKVKVSYRKTDEGDFERDIAIDRISSLDNTLIIVDEAHNLTSNSYGKALAQIIKNSINLKVLLLSATPMKNSADEIIELINFLRPLDKQIHRDRVFNGNKNHLMKFKPGGVEYLKKYSRGYVSYLKGGDPLLFAKRVDRGVKPKELLFTKIIPCKMEPFQHAVYNQISHDEEDTLDRRSEAVSSVVFPGLSEDLKSVQGYYGIEGISLIKEQLRTHSNLLNKMIAEKIIKDKNTDINKLIYISDNNIISGNIFNMKYLKHFSTKFHKTMTKLNSLVWGDKGAKTAFIYSNIVKVGIEIFQEVLLQNGYLEFQLNPTDYIVSKNTICYYCGRSSYQHHQEKDSKIPAHKFHPAAFIMVTGSTSEEAADTLPEEKQQILENTFNNVDNKEGKNIKLVLGSRVMNEGISLKNIAEIHILDVYFNLTRVDQVIGRGIRWCSHYNIVNKNNQFPEVHTYKYAIIIKDELSSEIKLYQKAELKHILVKKTERALKEVAIDCPLNMTGNIFMDDLKEFKDCVPPKLVKDGSNDVICPDKCDYTKCNFKCDDKLLNMKYYDPDRNLYKNIPKKVLNTSTFTPNLAKDEIDFAKEKIKELYKRKYVYDLPKIIDYVHYSYEKEKQDLFDEYFVYKALDKLIPITENDFNNFKDTIFDKYSRPGYLIYTDKYYIFQPFDQNENVPMYYRTTFNKKIPNELKIYDYLKNKNKDELNNFLGNIQSISDTSDNKNKYLYDFESTREYYDERKEFKYVGIIDKETSLRKSKLPSNLKDVFKIREERAKILDKKRGTGIPSLKGAVCSTSKSREYLEGIAKDLGLKLKKYETRREICNKVRDKLITLEKYSTGKNKMTYMMIPKNHKIFNFPLNLEDRITYIKTEIEKVINFKIKFEGDNSPKYIKGNVKKGEPPKIPFFDIKIKFNDIKDNLKSNSKLKTKINELGGHTVGNFIIFHVD
jgi:superfamily II DNA or RNA helicase